MTSGKHILRLQSHFSGHKDPRELVWSFAASGWVLMVGSQSTQRPHRPDGRGLAWSVHSFGLHGGPLALRRERCGDRTRPPWSRSIQPPAASAAGTAASARVSCDGLLVVCPRASNDSISLLIEESADLWNSVGKEDRTERRCGRSGVGPLGLMVGTVAGGCRRGGWGVYWGVPSPPAKARQVDLNAGLHYASSGFKDPCSLALRSASTMLRWSRSGLRNV